MTKEHESAPATDPTTNETAAPTEEAAATESVATEATEERLEETPDTTVETTKPVEALQEPDGETAPAAETVPETTEEVSSVAQPAEPTVAIEQPAEPTADIEQPDEPSIAVEQSAEATVAIERPAESAADVEQPAEPSIAVEKPADPAADVEPPADAEGSTEAATDEKAAVDVGRSIQVQAERPAIVAKDVSDLPDDLDFGAAIEATVLEFEEGDIVEGTVASIDQDGVLVDVGYKSEGLIPLRELSIRRGVDPNSIVKIGDRVEALVLDKEDDEGRLILSKKRAQYERAWGKIQRIYAEGGIVSGPVIEVVKGGLIVDIGLRGFLPASLVELRRVRDLQPYIGQDIDAKVIELDRNRNNVVLSRRAFLEEQQAEERQAFLDDLAVGETRKGVVSSVVNFGAFVDLGGMDGLVHVSELSYQHVNHPSEVVKVGDEVEVKVLEVDLDRERISLSMKQTQKDPWEQFSGEHQIGDVVEGVVTKTVPFGAFVSVGEGVEGLVHVSEIAMHRVESPELELSIGQRVQVKVTEMEMDRRRVSLSIKQALPEWKDRQEEQQRPPRSRPAPRVREFERERPDQPEREQTFDVDASLEAILQELKERGIGRR
jgi:small subunit ribosomal protein S1